MSADPPTTNDVSSSRWLPLAFVSIIPLVLPNAPPVVPPVIPPVGGIDLFLTLISTVPNALGGALSS